MKPFKAINTFYKKLNIFNKPEGTEEEGIWVETIKKPSLEFISMTEYNHRLNATDKVVGQRETGVWAKPSGASKSHFLPSEEVQKIGMENFISKKASVGGLEPVDTPLGRAIAASKMSANDSGEQRLRDELKSANQRIELLEKSILALMKDKPAKQRQPYSRQPYSAT